MPRHTAYKGLDKPRCNGLDRNGLSIIYITALSTRQQIDKAICRQIDKPYIPISPYHQSNGLSSPQNPTGYRRYTNIPSNRQTISSGYKGLVNMPGYKGLKV